MKYLYLILLIFFVAGCELIDPTEVENPNVSEDKFLTDIPEISSSWLNGLERQLAQTLNQTVVLGELLSDNYFNNRTLSSKVFDIPQISYQDVDVLSMQSAIHRLRTMAQYGLEEVAPNDAETSNEQIAEFHFYLGLAYLMSGENFVALPVETEGEVLSSEELFNEAIGEFEAALQLSTSSELQNTLNLALSRSYYHLGDRSNAVNAANQIINNAADFVRYVQYEENTPNDMQFFLFDSEANEFAPLPRLDFLDPKYFYINNPADEQKPIALFKSEEAYLIKAEAQIADNMLTMAKETMIDLLALVATRPTATFVDPDNRDGGTNVSVGIDPYPLSNEYTIQFEANEEAKTGLVLDRTSGAITVPTLSGTHVTNDMINAATTEDELLKLLYLMRQEIFFAEGRRNIDLGIKLPIAENEFTGNDNVSEAAIEEQIPPFIASLDEYGLDKFENDEAAKVITIAVDMNDILVNNKESSMVLPFH